MSQYFGDYIIEEAAVLFSNSYYTTFKCKIVDRITEHVISSNILNSCIESYMPINRKITDFVIEFWDTNSCVTKFQFRDQDLQEVTMFSSRQSVQSAKYGSNYIRLKKIADQCCLYLKVYEEDLEKQCTPRSFNPDLHLKVLQNFYEKITEKMIKKIQKINYRKISNKRYSNGHSNKISRKGKQNNQSSQSSSVFQRIKLPKKTLIPRIGQEYRIIIDSDLLMTNRKKKNNNQNFKHLYHMLTQTCRSKKTQKTGFEHLISETIQFPSLKCKDQQQQNPAQGVSFNGFITRKNLSCNRSLVKIKKQSKRCKESRQKCKPSIKQYNKPLQIRIHKRYTTLT